MTRELVEAIKKLERIGWIVEREPQPRQLNEAIIHRYSWIPNDVLEFFCETKILKTPEKKVWFLTNEDFNGISRRAFEWNAWELLSLDAAAKSRDWTNEIVSFWNAHLPILMSVKSCYAYYALEKTTNTIVQGEEPEFEGVSFVCESFAKFLNLVASNDPDLSVYI